MKYQNKTNLVETTIDLQIKAHQKTIIQLSIEIERLEQKKRILSGETIIDCLLSVRTDNCLRNAGFKYLEEAYLFYDENGDQGLLKLKNFGRKSLNELKDLFKEYGYMD
tara:strand:- start:806 stop:1132 length:327 start_codon:yes stop_codon:yes gene_type:complete